MLRGYDKLLSVISDFRQKEIDFHEYKRWLISSASSLGYLLDFNGDWYDCLDAWLEDIEFCYREEDWYELGCSLGDFIEHAIRDGPKPLKLPQGDRVIKEQFWAQNPNR